MTDVFCDFVKHDVWRKNLYMTNGTKVKAIGSEHKQKKGGFDSLDPEA